MPRPNWFLAFPIPGSFVLELPQLPARFRPFHPDDVHLTLSFLGGCGEAAALSALAALDRRLETSAPVVQSVSLAEIAPMGGSRRHYTALSALLGRGRAEVAALITELGGELLEAATGRRETRAAKPHVTLCRPPGGASDADREAGLAWAKTVDLTKIEAKLDRIALYTWAEVRRPRSFRIVAERTLG